MIEAVNGSAEWPIVITHLRIFQEADGAWSIDGYNERGESTPQVLIYDTYEEAVSKLSDFVKHLEADGIEFAWRKPKEKQ